MLTIDQLQTAMRKAEEHKRLERHIRAMYPAGRTDGVLFIDSGGGTQLSLQEDDEPEAFAAVIFAIRKRQAAIEADLAAMGISLTEAPAGA